MEVKNGQKVILSNFSKFKDNFLRRLLGKLFPSFDRSYDRNGEYKIGSDKVTTKKEA